MLDDIPSINYQEAIINGVTKKGFLVSCQDRVGFIYANYGNQSAEIMLNYNDLDLILDNQPCPNPESAIRLLELNVFREVENALQMMYDGEVVIPSTINWKTIVEV